MAITPMEIIDILIMTAGLGFIFKDIFARPRMYSAEDPLKYYEQPKLNNFKFAIYAVAPAVIFHELGHKFVALGFGMNAIFHAAYTWLGIGIVLRLMRFPFIFFVPGYVSLSCTNPVCMAMISANPWILSIVAFAGPGMNLLLWLGSRYALNHSLVPKKYIAVVSLSLRINLFLFIFNMLPIPPFDGFKVFSGIFASIF